MSLQRLRDGWLNVRQWGAGVPLLLVHGLGTSSAIWTYQLRPFAARYRVVAIDVRGFGRSPWPAEPFGGRDAVMADLLDVCEQLGEPVHYVGTSMGGFFGQLLALQRPDRVRSLCCINSAARNVIPEEVVHQRLAALQRMTMDDLAGLVVSQALGPGADAFLREWLYELIASNSPEVYARFLSDVIGGFDASGEVGRITVPTLVLTGELDRVIPPQHGAELARLVPGSVHHEIARVGHIACAEAPEELNRLVLGFLESVGNE